MFRTRNPSKLSAADLRPRPSSVSSRYFSPRCFSFGSQNNQQLFSNPITDSVCREDLVILGYSNQMTDVLNVIYKVNSLVLLPCIGRLKLDNDIFCSTKWLYIPMWIFPEVKDTLNFFHNINEFVIINKQA
jgi:hypothetical protein